MLTAPVLKVLASARAGPYHRLESEAYFQGRHTLDKYIDEFEELLRKSGYEDGKVAVVKFRRGLDLRI